MAVQVMLSRWVTLFKAINQLTVNEDNTQDGTTTTISAKRSATVFINL
jgi:hypothetical protein